jgi:ABC-type multidrug transport system ATPase subunit
LRGQIRGVIEKVARCEGEDSVMLGLAEEFFPVEIGELARSNARNLHGIRMRRAAGAEKFESAGAIRGDGWRGREQRIKTRHPIVANCATFKDGAPFQTPDQYRTANYNTETPRAFKLTKQVVFESVRKVFRHRPALFNWVGRERTGETVALKDVSFSAASGEVVALLGPNGSGKTSTLKLISTMLLADAGSVRVGGFDTQRDGGKVRRQVGIAVANERSFFPRLSARENLEFFAAMDEVPRSSRARRVEEVLSEVGLEEQADTLVMKFSSGMYQRLGLARAMIKRPAVLLLDEPTRSLDAAATVKFWAAIRALARRDTTVFVATHNFAEAAALASRVLLLHRGELLADRVLHRVPNSLCELSPVEGFSAEHSPAVHSRAEAKTADELRSLYFRLTGESMIAGPADGSDDICEVHAEDSDEQLARRAGAAS